MTKFAIAIASPSVREIGWVINISKRFIRFQLVNRLNRLIIKYKKQKPVISIEHKNLSESGAHLQKTRKHGGILDRFMGEKT